MLFLPLVLVQKFVQLIQHMRFVLLENIRAQKLELKPDFEILALLAVGLYLTSGFNVRDRRHCHKRWR
eukprot:1833052-Pyramimonas_sp.AAC.1